MISEPDAAVLNKLAEGVGRVERCERGLDALSYLELDVKLRRLVERSRNWILVVTLTPQRTRDWWLHVLKNYFGWPLSALPLKDGRDAFLTWRAH